MRSVFAGNHCLTCSEKMNYECGVQILLKVDNPVANAFKHLQVIAHGFMAEFVGVGADEVKGEIKGVVVLQRG
jgi:hypothetical protein